MTSRSVFKTLCGNLPEFHYVRTVDPVLGVHIALTTYSHNINVYIRAVNRAFDSQPVKTQYLDEVLGT
jgi:hypothetical protein